MQITFFTDVGELYPVEIDPQMELENIMALLEAESGIPPEDQSISFNGQEMSNPKATVAQYGVSEGSHLLLRRKVQVAGRTTEQDPEMMRLQILGDPELMQQLRAAQPDLAHAAQHDPARFAEGLRHMRARQNEVEAQRQREAQNLNADPYDVEAQRRIEEAIRQQAVMENLDNALEYLPEAFGRVTMLYIPVEVNGTPLVAFVDSGAQQTIMSPEYAEKCGIMRLLDRRFSGEARGVGTAKILGRVHTAQLKVADLHLPCSFTVMEGRDVDMLFGLDMLKAHQACIDLEKGCLRIQGREIKFLAEHELPAKARLDFAGNAEPEAVNAGPSSARPPHPSAPGAPQGNTSFPGSGHTLGAAPSSTPPGASRSRRPNFPENDINTLMGLGATREQAIQMLEQAGGNMDIAAALLFQ
ncbi:hypothetical protein SISSUDRAFT_798445 [Sistotremastrum suecicum HHB10207 ss-3]|uniref:DNA damage-inducible protein 1 n=1 Tax=Sistotremastrum suecicum HHB10207 ss-3 TaxID=1314776 RepID=A0A166HPZ5_9AGAM|nr:hypothetical protein SISSUDRAFT_798445 [Sistotremastrum suecicum HHB10207 ss-3]